MRQRQKCVCMFTICISDLDIIQFKKNVFPDYTNNLTLQVYGVTPKVCKEFGELLKDTVCNSVQ